MSADPTVLASANIRALVDADPRSVSEVARSCFPKSTSRAALVRLCRARGVGVPPTWPTADTVISLIDGLGLTSMAPIFEVDSPSLDEASVAELVLAIERQGHRVELDRDDSDDVDLAEERDYLARVEDDLIDGLAFDAIKAAGGPVFGYEVRAEVGCGRYAVRSSLARLTASGRVLAVPGKDRQFIVTPGST